MPKVCEPMGAAEVAAFLGVKRETVHMWQFRGNMPQASWIVNGAPAWNMPDVVGWAIATDRLAPEAVDDAIANYKPEPTRRGRG